MGKAGRAIDGVGRVAKDCGSWSQIQDRAGWKKCQDCRPPRSLLPSRQNDSTLCLAVLDSEELKYLARKFVGLMNPIIFVAQIRGPGPVAGERIQPFCSSLEIERIVPGGARPGCYFEMQICLWCVDRIWSPGMYAPRVGQWRRKCLQCQAWTCNRQWCSIHGGPR